MVIDHVTSPTALVFPIEDIVAALEPEIPVVVDGAHGPGQISVALDDLGASWYTGNLHKWVCAPKGRPSSTPGRLDRDHGSSRHLPWLQRRCRESPGPLPGALRLAGH